MITISKSFKEFINNCDNKIARYLTECLDPCSFNIYKKLFTEEEINYLTFRNDGTISFLPKGKKHKENEDGTWKRDGRQNGKPSKVIQKIITPFGKKLFNEKDFENFTNCYKVEFNDENLKFQLLPNTEIGNIYLSDALDGDGSLNNSCMRIVPSSYFEIYENCKDLQILVLKKNELIAGRALVWKIGDITLMDRVYTAKEHYFEMFFNYAKENKWWRKYKQSYDNKDSFIDVEGNCVGKTFKIYTDTDWDDYPYIDTFTYGEDGMLTNDSRYSDYEYNETDGTRNSNNSDDEHEGETWDDIDDCYIDEDDAYRIGRGRYNGSYTHRDNTIADVDDDIWWEGDTDIVLIGDDYYPKNHEDIRYDNLNEEYILQDDSIEITKGTHKGSFTLESETTEDYDGEIWADCDRDVLITEINNKWYDAEDVIEIDGSYYLENDEEIELINGTYQLKIEEHAE